MSDQDELRDRIEDIIWKRTALPTDITVLVAQAIIDELGLTMEMRVSSVGRTVDRRTGIVTNSTQTRIVGKWKKHE